MESVRIGVIGLGWFGEVHCDAIQATLGLEPAGRSCTAGSRARSARSFPYFIRCVREGKLLAKAIAADAPSAKTRRRLGFLEGEIAISGDFDRIGAAEVETMFDRDSKTPARRARTDNRLSQGQPSRFRSFAGLLPKRPPVSLPGRRRENAGGTGQASPSLPPGVERAGVRWGESQVALPAE